MLYCYICLACETPFGPGETPFGPGETPFGPCETPFGPGETPIFIVSHYPLFSKYKKSKASLIMRSKVLMPNAAPRD